MLIQQLVDVDILKTIIILVLSISLIVFVALFGRLPIFRKTPIAFFHRLLTRTLPNALVKIDTVLTGRRLSRGLYSTGHYLMYEKHPLVLIFFVALQTAGEAAMIPALWPTLAVLDKLLIPIAISLPHYFLYLTATTSSAISLPSRLSGDSDRTTQKTIRHHQPPENLDFGPAHHSAHHAYPYDYLLYHPGFFCSTCHVPKPARSKHCSLCRACIQKADHHCIWVNNCVGRNNYLWFLLLLVSITGLLVYGCSLGWMFMRVHLDAAFTWQGGSQGRSPGQRQGFHQGSSFTTTTRPTTWSENTDWTQLFDRLAYAMMQDVRVGATTLLCAMTTPLGGAFLIYHTYLLWVGMTTNEQGKWSDWKEDVRDEVVFRADIRELRRGLRGSGRTRTGYKEEQQQDEDENQLLGRYPPLPREVEPGMEEVDWPPGRLEWLLDGEVDGGGYGGEDEDADGVESTLGTAVRAGRGGTWKTKWRARWWYIRTRDGDQPALTLKVDEAKARGVVGGDVVDGEVEVDDHRWKRVKSMRIEMDNIYDLGFWGNLLEVVYHRNG